ncbi:ATP-binding protein [Phenylobacterium sp.]|uniref:sensor histidine kinase n=1 Tax=Phenylobacterium sp. TaxID=1871053 RepID=UPI0025CE0AA0|nr:ATP-binding protein [Phenylobacterium sp.]MBX3484720.1 HAMP domain-containing protein [Phenylobacterium sp.]
MKPLFRFVDSMAGRIFLILLVGIVLSALLALTLADGRRRAEVDQLRLEGVADRTQYVWEQLGRAPEPERTRLAREGAAGVRATLATTTAPSDVALTRLLTERLGAAAQANAQKVDFETCFHRPGRIPMQRQPDRTLQPPQCWLVTGRLEDGAPIRLSVDTPPLQRDDAVGLDPLFLGVLALAALGLSFVVALVAARPLNALARAARALGRNLDHAYEGPTGPYEVREAATAFDRMQADLKRHLAERTQMLAAIAHDLQTPLTRLRLRLDKVAEPALRDALIGDVQAMHDLVREGLELARSEQAVEPLVPLDLASLLESLVEDAQDAGRQVVLTHREAIDVLARPLALRRCLENLVDNAVKYGGSAEVASERGRGGVAVRIRDHGPGIPEDRIEELFRPFVRLEESRSRETGGSGLGLAIARRLAAQNGAELVLRNHPGGGLEATLLLPWPSTAAR